MCPNCRDEACTILRSEAEALLVAADKAERRQQTANRDWCYRAAMGCARAIGILKRPR